MPIVIDANIALSWLLETGATGVAAAALDALADDGGVVPALWRWEVQDVLRRYDERGALSRSLDFVLRELHELPIVVDDELKTLFGDELALAQQYGLSVYGAAYLELALRRRSALATLDRTLARAARAAGIAFRG